MLEKLAHTVKRMMDHQTLLNIFFGLLSACAGWFAREMWSAVKELKGDLAKLREEIPTKYVARDEFKDGIREIKDDFKDGFREVKEVLNKIFDRLDQKVDK